MEISLRPAVETDAAEVLRLVCAGGSVTDAATGAAAGALTEAYVKTYLASPASHILLAHVPGRAVGLLSYSTRPDLFHAAASCLVEELVVEPGWRGQGIGGMLLEALLQAARAQGCAEVCLAVMPDNPAAIRFYRRHGLTDEALLLERHFTPQQEAET